MPKNRPYIILGIDPGFATTGFAFIKKEGADVIPLDFGVITTPTHQPFYQRLFVIFSSLSTLIDQFHPQYLSVEKIYFSKNVKTAIDVGHGRGVILLLGAIKKMRLFEFTPLQVKQAIAAYGRADKLQMQKMVQIVYRLEEIPSPDDAADALAIAYCCAQQLQL